MTVSSSLRRAIISADDFGMSYEVNEAIEQAHRQGVLTTTSLMVAAPAAEDALRRARRLPHLKVGLHLVTIEGDSVLKLPAITDQNGWFGRHQVRLGFEYFFSPAARSAIKREIEAQFRAFSLSGLPLDHANAHKHMHLHPTISRMLITIGKNYGLKALRTPAEPAAPLNITPTFSDKALWYWTQVLRQQIRHAGLKTNDTCFGLRWSGHMTPERVQSLIPHLPKGVSEIYFHPATEQNAQMAALMPGYDQTGELTALLAPQTKATLEQCSIQSIGWADI